MNPDRPSDPSIDPSNLAPELSCTACDELLIDHVYGETESAQRGAVARHLAECSSCALAFCRLKADLDGVLAAAVEAPPAALRRRIRTEVARSFGRRWWDRALELWRRPVPAYGMLLASLVPMLAWAALSARPPAIADDAAPDRAPRPPALIDYDSMVPLLPEDRPL